MAYCNSTDIISQVGDNNYIPFLDDDSSGQADTSLMDNIISVADAAINGRIASIYTVPVSPTPPLLRYASIIFTCEMLYRRRLAPREHNPYTKEADALREQLTKIGSGELNLDQTVDRAYEQGAVAGRGTIYGVMGSNILGNSM